MWFVGDPYIWPSGKEAPIWEGGRILPKINLLSGITNPTWGQIFFIAVMVCAVLTMFGLWTRISTFLLAVGVVSIHHRTPMLLMGGDSVMRISCLYLALSPCGTVCSVDRLIALWKGKIQPVPVVVSLWTQRLVTYNVALIYVTTVWLKWYGFHWKAGDATYYTANLPEFFRFPVPYFLNTSPMYYVNTWGALLIEFMMGTLVFYRPLRKYVLAGGVILHGGIEYSMNVPLFGYFLVSCYIVFFDGEEVTAWFKRLGERLKRFRITVSSPADRKFKPGALAVLKAIDPLCLVTYSSGQGTELEVSRESDSQKLPRWSIFARSLGAWPFFAVPWIGTSLLRNSLEP
jgi:hypothetical protein